MNFHAPPGRADPALRRFSTDDLRRMTEAGILDEDERVELLDGELVEMAAKGHAHEVVKNALLRLIIPAVSSDVYLASESTLRCGPHSLIEPDILLAPRAALSVSTDGFSTISGPEILLVIEIAASSLAYDLGRKARLYAQYGVREYWVIAAQERAARMHLGPREDGSYGEVNDHAADAILVPRAEDLAGLKVALADLA
ncbi:Uma2 family endonuclease [Methylobacterium sp. JK268]